MSINHNRSGGDGYIVSIYEKADTGDPAVGLTSRDDKNIIFVAEADKIKWLTP